MKEEKFPQPKIFVGTHNELQIKSQENGWNPKDVICIHSVDSVTKLYGLKIKRDEVYYGETISLRDSDRTLRIRRELDFFLKSSEMKIRDEIKRPKPKQRRNLQ